MVKNNMESLREKLNKLVGEYDCDNRDVLRVSEELDVLIVNYLKKHSLKKVVAVVNK